MYAMIRIYKNLSTKFSNRVNKINTTSPYKSSTLSERFSFFRHSPCQLCDEATNKHPFFCADCYFDLPVIHTKCTICCLPIHLEKQQTKEIKLICGECITTPPSFTRTLCPFKYEFPIKQIIRQIKYSKQQYWIKALSWAFIQEGSGEFQKNTFVMPDILIPIPMHKSKRKVRTYNQAELIAAALSKNTGIPFSTKILLKSKATDTQAQLNKQERMKNLKDSFCISEKALRQGHLSGKHIALIDDVMTTKATCELASKLLLDNNAKQVDIWCLARTPKVR